MAGLNSRSFLKHAAVYGFGTLLLQAASVVLLPLYTRYLTPADYGTLEILNRVGQVLGIVKRTGRGSREPHDGRPTGGQSVWPGGGPRV